MPTLPRRHGDRPPDRSAGLPDAKSPDLRGAYAHALKSVAVGPDGAVYFSIGSTGNISARPHRVPAARHDHADPARRRAASVRTGVRNGTGLAIAPDGSVWTAVNNRDNVATPQTARSKPTTSTSIRPSPSRGSLRAANWAGPTAIPTAAGQPCFIRDVQTNPEGSKLDCAALPPVEQSLGAHAAPLGMSFTREHADRTVCQRRADRGARIVEPPAPARTRGRVLPLAATALSPISRLLSAVSRPTTARVGSPGRRGGGRTERSTSPKTTPAPSTGWRRASAPGFGAGCR